MDPTKLSLSTDGLSVFFDKAHQTLSSFLRSDTSAHFTRNGAALEDPANVARAMGDAMGLYRYLVPEKLGGAPVSHSDHLSYIDVRCLVLIREALGQLSPLADSIFAVQGLGSYPIALAGTDSQIRAHLPDVISGARIAGFGLTEPDAGSDVASIATRAERVGSGWRLNGDKTLISNAPLAHHYVVFANADPSLGRKGITAFIVPSDARGLTITPLPMSVSHPIGNLTMRDCELSDDALLGSVGGGFKLAMQTLDAFRISVGAAANGMASAALSDTLTRVKSRKQFGVALCEHQIVQAYLAEMATELEAGRLLVARAAHLKDTTEGRITIEAAMAKMYATEAAQRIIDKAVQLHGGSGVIAGSRVEHLYRDIRPLRIYEGTTEIQKLIIARGLLSNVDAG